MPLTEMWGINLDERGQINLCPKLHLRCQRKLREMYQRQLQM